MNYKPIGGVKSTTLRFASQSGEAVVVPIVDDSSCYSQSISALDAPIVVRHLLQISARRADSSAWLSRRFVERGVIEGFVASVVLNDGRSFDLGTLQQPLRLVELKDSSGSALSDTPIVTLTLQCENSTLTD